MGDEDDEDARWPMADGRCDLRPLHELPECSNIHLASKMYLHFQLGVWKSHLKNKTEEFEV